MYTHPASQGYTGDQYEKLVSTDCVYFATCWFDAEHVLLLSLEAVYNLQYSSPLYILTEFLYVKQGLFE